ncbi:MAG: limonene-1,2-epoxide hydrolase family protein [Ilumatobacteraceae bacterium]|jgi:limonene-1,2-epoxide hydrolase
MNPLETVNAFIAALERLDVDGACALIAEGCEYDNVPLMKVYGPEGVKGVLGPMFGDCTEVEWVVHREAANGTTVFNERTDRFKMSWGWLELPVNGVWEVVDDKITLWRDYFDAQSYFKQLPAS